MTTSPTGTPPAGPLEPLPLAGPVATWPDWLPAWHILLAVLLLCGLLIWALLVSQAPPIWPVLLSSAAGFWLGVGLTTERMRRKEQRELHEAGEMAVRRLLRTQAAFRRMRLSLDEAPARLEALLAGNNAAPQLSADYLALIGDQAVNIEETFLDALDDWRKYMKLHELELEAQDQLVQPDGRPLARPQPAPSPSPSPQPPTPNRL